MTELRVICSLRIIYAASSEELVGPIVLLPSTISSIDSTVIITDKFIEKDQPTVSDFEPRCPYFSFDDKFFPLLEIRRLWKDSIGYANLNGTKVD